MHTTIKEVTVFRFPQHSAEIDALPAAEEAKMEELAHQIADSFLTGNNPIVAFTVIGHADRDARGTDFENSVSINRAEAAKAWLVQHAKTLVQQGGGDPTDIDLAEFSLFGQGTSALYTQDPTFPAREMNRRVVIKYAAVEIDPTLNQVGFAANLARARLLIGQQPQTDETRRVICALDKIVNPAVDDTFFEWGSLRQIAGGLGGLSDEQVLAAARSVIKSLRQDIANNNLYGVPNIFGLPSVPDDIVVANLRNWEGVVRDCETQLIRQMGIAPTGEVHKSVAKFIARKKRDPMSILSCFP